MRTLFAALGILTISWALSFEGSVFVLADTTVPATSPAASQQTPPTTTSQAAADKEAQKAALQQQLAQVEAELQQLQGNINEQEAKKKSLQQQVKIFQSKIAQTQLEIQQLTLAIQQTDLQIQETQQGIDATNAHIEQEKQRLATLLEEISQSDQTSTVQLLLQYHTFSDFFNRAESLQALDEGVKANLADLQQSAKDLQQRQINLGDQQDAQDQLRQTQTFQQDDLRGQLTDENALLTETKGQESRFQALAAQKQETATQIRNQLFILGGAGGIKLPFDQAYKYASVASRLTNVRAAFLLAVLRRESQWGYNVGKCYLVDSNTGVGHRENSTDPVANVMKPTRDVQPFMQITQLLGRDPYTTAVSCPLSYGYGGAMGPAQFLPSTWMVYQQSVSGLVGHAADPWDIQDAFVASAVKLANAGATAQTVAAERKAALIYYAGGGWSNPAYRAYTDAPLSSDGTNGGVTALAAQYQSEIDILNSSGG